jgi:hypothetical protein
MVYKFKVEYSDTEGDKIVGISYAFGSMIVRIAEHTLRLSEIH